CAPIRRILEAKIIEIAGDGTLALYVELMAAAGWGYDGPHVFEPAEPVVRRAAGAQNLREGLGHAVRCREVGEAARDGAVDRFPPSGAHPDDRAGRRPGDRC